MNINENHLISPEEFELRKQQGLAGMFQQVPDFLEHAAKVKLNGESEAKVSFTSGGKLSNWAKKIRKNNGIPENDETV